MQLDLLTWFPSTATIIPFPAHLRSGKIRRTAQILVESTNKAATYHWRRTIDDMTRQMERAGLSPEIITAEVHAFSSAVDAEIARRTYGARQSKNEGDDVA